MRVNDLKTKSGVSLKRDFKLVVLALIILCSFAIYTLKLFSMQVLEGAQYRQQSEDISSRVKTIPAQRGEIYDRNATVPMVVNTDSFAVEFSGAGTVVFDLYVDGSYHSSVTLEFVDG